MCNRYSAAEKKLVLESEFGLVQAELAERFNIAPRDPAPVVLVSDGRIALHEFQWGFDGLTGQPVTNARSETAHEKPMFRDAWRAGHCIVPADGFFEWKQMHDGKQPFRFVRRQRGRFWFAGLHEQQRFTILTTAAQGIVAGMHDRMPVILRADALDWWLGTAQRTPDELIAHSAPANELECYPVTRAMSNARHKGADSIAPIRINEQPALF